MRFVVNTKPRAKAVRVKLIIGEAEHLLVQDATSSLVIGMGKREAMTLRQLRLLVRKAIVLAKANRIPHVALDVSEWIFPTCKVTEEELVELLVTNILLANYAFTQYKAKLKEDYPGVETVTLCGIKKIETARRGLGRGVVVAEETNHARSIANTPASDMTPESLARHARRTFRKLPIKVTVWDEKRLAKEHMTGILTVGQGSEAKPRLVIAEYHAGKKGEAPMVLVGKGVTFDSGGINLKPSQYILGMNMDMSGGASVIHALAACARLKVAKNIIALIPAVENMISGRSYRPGDIIRTASGKTIEVQDTDAEGRIILSDVLHYAKRYHPKLVIDVATLTGSSVVALGERAAALFTEDETLEATLRQIGTQVGDPVWPLPLWDEYLEDIKGVYGDLGNVGHTKYGGAITAALFLKQFTQYPWVHLDIAPRMTSIGGEHLAKGAIGAGVQLLIRFLSQK